MHRSSELAASGAGRFASLTAMPEVPKGGSHACHQGDGHAPDDKGGMPVTVISAVKSELNAYEYGDD